MLKNKNGVAKVSNIFFVVIGFMSLLSLATLIFGGKESIESFSQNDYNYNIVIMIVYTLLSFLILFVTNKKIDLYKEEYPVSRRVFNLFIVISFMSVVITFVSNVLNIYFYDNFSWTTLITIIVGYVPSYLIAIKEVSKGKLLNKDNDHKVNIANLVIVYLLMNYYVNCVAVLSQMLFKMGDVITLVGSLCFSIIWMCIVMISYKLINKKEEFIFIKKHR